MLIDLVVVVVHHPLRPHSPDEGLTDSLIVVCKYRVSSQKLSWIYYVIASKFISDLASVDLHAVRKVNVVFYLLSVDSKFLDELVSG